MSDTPIVPSVQPTAPVISSNTSNTSNKSVTTPKVDVAAVKAAATIPVDKIAADKVKTDTAAEKAVIQKIKIGDMEYDEKTLQSMIDKSSGADKKFLEASKMRKEAMRFFKLAKDNPKEFLAKTGMDADKFKKFAYDEVAQDIKNKLRDPKEVALEEAEKRIKDYEARDAEQKKLADEAKLDREAKALEQKFHAEMIEALEAYPELPKNGFTVAKLAEAIETVRNKTGILLTAKEVAPKVVSDMRRQIEGVVKGLSAEQLISLIGKESVDAILKHSLTKIKDPLSGSKGAQGTSEDKPKEKRWKSSNDFWKTIDKAAKQERGE